MLVRNSAPEPKALIAWLSVDHMVPFRDGRVPLTQIGECLGFDPSQSLMVTTVRKRTRRRDEPVRACRLHGAAGSPDRQPCSDQTAHSGSPSLNRGDWRDNSWS